MNIVFYLKKFFNEQQGEAAIPGLGVFCLSSESGKHRTIIFKEKAPRSKVFVNYLAYEENITEGEAIAIVEEWVADILDRLKSSNFADIADLGSFSIMSDGKVIFTGVTVDFNAVEEIAKEDDDYGLDRPKPHANQAVQGKQPMKVKKEKEHKKPKHHKKEDASSKASTMILIIVAVILVLVAAVALSYKFVPSVKQKIDTMCGKSSNVTTGTENAETIEAPVVEDAVIESSDTTTHVMATTNVVAAETVKQKVDKPQAPTYNVIGGAFGVKENADKFRKEMVGKGYPKAELIYNSQKGLYMVSLAQFGNINDAMNFKEKVRNNSDISCWVYKK